MPTKDESTYKSFYGNINLDEETSVAQLQAIAILTSPNPIAAEIAYLSKKNDTKKDVNLGAVKLLLRDMKPTEDDEWTLTAASDSQFELDLHGMDAADKIYQLSDGNAFSAEQYKAIQVYKRFLVDMKNMTLGVGTQIAEATLPKAEDQLKKIEEEMSKKTADYFADLTIQVKSGSLEPVKLQEANKKKLLLKQIYDNKLLMIDKQRLNHTPTKFHHANTSIAATAFHTTAAVSGVLVAIASFVPVINLFAHPLKLGLEMVNYSLLIAAYNLDPKMKEGPNQYNLQVLKEMEVRRAAAKVHLDAIKTAKLKQVTTGLLGSAALVGAFFAGPLAPFLAPIGAAGLLISNLYAQKAIQAEIALLRKVGIKRDENGDPVMEPVRDKEGKLVYENVITLKDGKEITERRIKRQEVRLMKDYDLRLKGLQTRLAGRKWNTYAAGTALGGTLGTAAIAVAVLLGVSSAVFPPLLFGIIAATACVALFCAIKSVKKTYDEKQLTTTADLLANHGAVTDMNENLNKLSNQLGIKIEQEVVVKASKEAKEGKEFKEKLETSKSPSVDMSKSLLTLSDSLQQQKDRPGEAVSSKSSQEISHKDRNAPAPKEVMEHQLLKRIEKSSGSLRDNAKDSAMPDASTTESKLSSDHPKENRKDKDEKEAESEGRSAKRPH